MNIGFTKGEKQSTQLKRVSRGVKFKNTFLIYSFFLSLFIFFYSLFFFSWYSLDFTACLWSSKYLGITRTGYSLDSFQFQQSREFDEKVIFLPFGWFFFMIARIMVISFSSTVILVHKRIYFMSSLGCRLLLTFSFIDFLGIVNGLLRVLGTQVRLLFSTHFQQPSFHPAISLFSDWLLLSNQNCPLTFNCADGSVSLALNAISPLREREREGGGRETEWFGLFGFMAYQPL